MADALMRGALCAAVCAMTVMTANGAVSDRETRRAADQSEEKSGIVITGCLKAADELGLPKEKTQDSTGAPYFVLTNAQPASAQSGGGLESGAPYRVIGISPRMLHARADTQVEITGKLAPSKAGALHPVAPAETITTPRPDLNAHPGEQPRTTMSVLDGTLPIDSLPVINAKSIKTLLPRCADADSGR